MKSFRFLITTLVLAICMQACKPEAIKPIGDANSNIAALAGNWQLVKVMQKDEDAATKGFPYQTTDLTTSFPYTDFRLTLNINGNNPSTFTTTPGNAPKVITLASGNWAVDNVAAPQALTLTSGTQSQVITLGSYPNATNNKLKISVQRRDLTTNKLLITYSYEFVKQ